MERLRGKQSLSNLFAHNCLFLSRKSLKQTCRERSAPPARSRGKRILPSARRAPRAAKSPRRPTWRVGEMANPSGARGAGDSAGGASVRRGALYARPAAGGSGPSARSLGRPAAGAPGKARASRLRVRLFAGVKKFDPNRCRTRPGLSLLGASQHRGDLPNTLLQVAAGSAGAAGADLFGVYWRQPLTQGHAGHIGRCSPWLPSVPVLSWRASAAFHVLPQLWIRLHKPSVPFQFPSFPFK